MLVGLPTFSHIYVADLPLRDEVRPDAEDSGRSVDEVRAVEASLSTAHVTVHRTTVTATIRRPSFVDPCGTHTQTLSYLLQFCINLHRLCSSLPQIAVIQLHTDFKTALVGSMFPRHLFGRTLKRVYGFRITGTTLGGDGAVMVYETSFIAYRVSLPDFVFRYFL
jgi:hypothetical protein